MRDGVRVSVHANLERLEEMDELQASGAEGVGLYRTEFSFLREHLPSEEELYAEYSAVARKAAPAHVVFRTLDAGADKMLRAQEALKEPNPALGLRGIRFCLRHQKIFRSQLRALMRAGVEGNISPAAAHDLRPGRGTERAPHHAGTAAGAAGRRSAPRRRSAPGHHGGDPGGRAHRRCPGPRMRLFQHRHQ